MTILDSGLLFWATLYSNTTKTPQGLKTDFCSIKQKNRKAYNLLELLWMLPESVNRSVISGKIVVGFLANL